MNILKRTWTEISLESVKHNFNEIKSKIGNSKLCCVIKADGYGHGAVQFAHIYEKLGADFFAVSNIDEAIELRDNNITLPILVLGYTPVSSANVLVKYNIIQTIYSLDYAKVLNDFCVENNLNINAHIKVDTGMSRIGYMCQEFPRDNNSINEIKSTYNLSNINVEGIFTHFCVSDEGEDGKAFTEKQLSNLTYVIDKLKDEDITFKYIHSSNSGAIEDYPETYFSMVRAGVILYGLSPSEKIKEKLNLIPCMTMKTVIAHVKEIKAGSTVSYGRTFTAPKDMKIATVPIGYADGFIRSYAKDGYMVINGKKANVIGRICMDQTMLDVTDIENVNIGDEVIVFGDGSNGERTCDDLAKVADTINYEVVCIVSKRVPRFFVEKGKITEVMYKI